MKKVLVSMLAVAAVAATAPAARAHAPVAGCVLYAIQQDDLTGQYFEGFLVGQVTHSTGGPVTVRCYVKVNGMEVSSSPTGTGNSGFAPTFGRATVSASEVDVVTLVAEYTTEHGTYYRTYYTTTTQVPPQAFKDVIASVLYDLVDPALCPFLGWLAGDYGPVTINPQGDVFIDGFPYYDCPPYDLQTTTVLADVRILSGGSLT